jgi:hypothetical protein
MGSQIMFLDCPAYFDEEGSVRCGLPTEVEYRYTQGSTGGQLESAKIDACAVIGSMAPSSP